MAHRVPPVILCGVGLMAHRFPSEGPRAHVAHLTLLGDLHGAVGLCRLLRNGGAGL